MCTQNAHAHIFASCAAYINRSLPNFLVVLLPLMSLSFKFNKDLIFNYGYICKN